MNAPRASGSHRARSIPRSAPHYSDNQSCFINTKTPMHGIPSIGAFILHFPAFDRLSVKKLPFLPIFLSHTQSIVYQLLAITQNILL